MGRDSRRRVVGYAIHHLLLAWQQEDKGGKGEDNKAGKGEVR